MINKNSSKNCRAYNSFVSVASDHRIVIERIQLCLRSNKNKKSCKVTQYNWSCLKNDTVKQKLFVTNITYFENNLFKTACK